MVHQTFCLFYLESWPNTDLSTELKSALILGAAWWVFCSHLILKYWICSSTKILQLHKNNTKKSSDPNLEAKIEFWIIFPINIGCIPWLMLFEISPFRTKSTGALTVEWSPPCPWEMFTLARCWYTGGSLYLMHHVCLREKNGVCV